ncbi:MAG: hypothetical protein FWG61_03930 [Firmicutes bacterium]|nr:hypothetical protein [Bacillota bacterium]
MNHIVDMTKKRFGKVDFSEAHIVDLFCPLSLPISLEFTLWGATLLLAPHWKELAPDWNYKEILDGIFPNDDNYYISGFGVVKITNLVGGEVDFDYYENIKSTNNRRLIAKNHDGSRLIHNRKWPFKKTKGLDEYLWENNLVWPRGGCVLRLFSDNGAVTFEFDTDDMIPAEKYCMNPRRYGFNEKKIK